MKPAGRYLSALAQRNAEAYLAHTQPVAILLVGSAARDECDFFSDLDLLLYYDELPTDEQLERARRQITDAAFRPLGPRGASSVLDTYSINGIECQAGHMLVAGVEHDLTRVLREFDIDPVLHKKILGLQGGVPLHGAELIHRWQARLADFPDGLARTMVEHYLGQIFPMWFYQDMLAQRDTVLWQQQLLVECAHSILGILAGLNRRYYSPFQFKRMRQFIAGLRIAPDHLAEQLEGLFDPSVPAASRATALVRATLDLVDQHRSDVNTTTIRDQLDQRQRTWTIPAEWDRRLGRHHGA